MKLKDKLKFISIGLAIALALIIIGQTTTGCATKTQVTPASTNSAGVVTPATTNVVINPTTFATECLVIGGAVSVGMPILVQYDPAIQPDLHLAYVALNGVLNGASTNSASQIISLLGKSAANAATAGAISNIVTLASNWEQSELAKYGTNAYEQVVVGEAKAAVAAWPAQDQ